jgi:hypothetical protein
MFRAQVAGLHALCLRGFEEEVGKGLKRGEGGFAKTVMVCKERVLGRFDEEAGEVVIEGTGWSYEHDRELLVQDIDGVTARLRKEEIGRLSERLEKQVKAELEEPVSVVFAKPTDTIWDNLISEFDKIKDEKVEAFKEKAVMGLNATEEDVTDGIEGLKTRAWMCLRDRLDGETEPTHLLLRLREQYPLLSPLILMSVLRINSGTTNKVFHESGNPPTTSTPSSNPPKNPYPQPAPPLT